VTTWPTRALSSPEMQGWNRLRELINGAVGDPAVSRSPDALMLAAFFSEILHDSTPETWSQLFVDRAQRAVGRWNAEKSKVARRPVDTESRKQIAEAWSRLQPSQQGRGAASIIATAVGKSAPTVRAHLRDLGLHSPSKRK
jgi:hypothetical protein